MKPGSLELGRLAIVKDPEGKRRVIAMSDYWSQFFLKKIHSDLLGCLKKLPQDRTFTQDPKNQWNNTEPFNSLDLSSATDRFPLFLQVKLISILYNRYAFSQIWKEILVNRKFAISLDSTDTVQYKVGQPMGSYSSW
jgi:hypothetical protein